MDSVFQGQVGILRFSQPQCDLGVPLNKLNVCLCGLCSSACPETSENEREMASESTEAFRAPGREEERHKTTPPPPSQHTPLDVIALGCLLSCVLAGSPEGRALQ